MNRFETPFDANYTYYTTKTRRILKLLELFENLAFVIKSTRENIRLIARASFVSYQPVHNNLSIKYDCSWSFYLQNQNPSVIPGALGLSAVCDCGIS